MIKKKGGKKKEKNEVLMSKYMMRMFQCIFSFFTDGKIYPLFCSIIYYCLVI